MITGGCQCGSVRYAIDLKQLEQSHVCHCRMCQKATGGLFAALAGSPKDKLEWTKGEPASFSSSNLATRLYCRDCGTPLTFAYNQPEARIYVTIGSLDDPESAPIINQYGIESRISWVSFCPDVPSQPTLDTPEARAFFAGMTKNQV